MRIRLLLLALFLAGSACSGPPKAVRTAIPATPQAEKPVPESEPVVQKVNFQRPETWLMGPFTQDMMTRPPHDQWYTPEYNSYKPVQELVHRIQEANTGGISVLIVLGTWCPDSHREVPRFIKLLDECGMARIGVKFLGVDMNKYAPVGDYEKLEIKRVPTFIVYRNNIEIGRIIEYPVTSLEGDFTEILHRKN
ncbi:MAG: thioredoxin family protein [Bacteroidetes bacterium]|nr:thioredoxin family protein [Bacteroidota bacterium]